MVLLTLCSNKRAIKFVLQMSCHRHRGDELRVEKQLHNILLDTYLETFLGGVMGTEVMVIQNCIIYRALQYTKPCHTIP